MMLLWHFGSCECQNPDELSSLCLFVRGKIVKWEEFLGIQVKSLAISLQLRPIPFTRGDSAVFRVQDAEAGPGVQSSHLY